MSDNNNEYLDEQATLPEDPLNGSYHIKGMEWNSDIIYDFLQGERGYFFDKQQGKYIKFSNDIEEGFNNIALKELYNILHSVVNRSNVSADLNNKDINNIMRDTMTTLVMSMTRNRKRWNLLEHTRDSLRNKCENLIYIFLTKTKEGRAADLHYGGGSPTERINHTDSFDKSNNQGGLRN